MKIKDLQQLAAWMSDNSFDGHEITAMTIKVNHERSMALQDELKNMVAAEFMPKMPNTSISTPFLAVKISGKTFNIVESYGR